MAKRYSLPARAKEPSPVPVTFRTSRAPFAMPTASSPRETVPRLGGGKQADPNPKEVLSTRERRSRWLKILTTGAAMAKRPGKMAFEDLSRMKDNIGFKDELKLRELFDRLDGDGDGLVSEHEWDMIHALLSHDALVRAEEHPNFCAYFKMLHTGALPFERISEIMDTKGLDSRILATPNNMLPLSPRAHSNVPAPMLKPLAYPASDSKAALAAKPSFRSGAHVVSLPGLPHCPPALQPRRGGNVVTQSAARWASMVLDGIMADNPHPLRLAASSHLYDVNAVVHGGEHGRPYAVGRSAFAFFSEEQFRKEAAATRRRIDVIIRSERKARLPFEIEQIHHTAQQRLRHNGRTDNNDDEYSTLLFDRVAPGDTFLHLSARCFSPEVACYLLGTDIDIEAVNAEGESFLEVFSEALDELRSTPLQPRPPRKFLGDAAPKKRLNAHLSARTQAQADAAKKADAEAAAEEPNPSKVRDRLLERKRREDHKVSWFRRCLQDLTKILRARLTEIEAIHAKTHWLNMAGEQLAPSERKRLDAREHVEGLLRNTNQLLARVDDAEAAIRGGGGGGEQQGNDAVMDVRVTPGQQQVAVGGGGGGGMGVGRVHFALR